MNPQNDYQFARVPRKLMYCLDRNCRSLMFALVDLADYFNSNKFYRSNEDLQNDTDLSKNLVIATLDTLYQKGLIDVDCVGKGVGRQTNIITINTYKFKDWERYTFDEVRKLPELKINTVKYKGSGYKASYLNKNNVEVSCYSNLQEVSQTTSQETLQKVNTIKDTKEDKNSKENKNTKENILSNKEDNLSKELKNDLQKVNTSFKGDLPTCKIDTTQKESLKEKKDSFNIECKVVKLDEDMVSKGFVCCSDFVNKYKNLDYQTLLSDYQQFLKDNEIKISCLTQNIISSTGVSFSKQVATQLLKDYVVINGSRQYQEETISA